MFTRPRFAFAPDQGGAGDGTRQNADESGKTIPDPKSSEAGKVLSDQKGPESKTTESDELPDDPAILKARLKKGEATLAEMRAKFEERSAAEEKAKQAALKDQGKFKELYEAAAPKVEQLTRYEAVINKILDAELKNVPESLKGLIPEGDPVSKLDWIAKAREAGAFTPAKPAAKGGDGSPPPGNGMTPKTMTQFMAMGAKDRAAYMAAGGTVTD